MGGFLGIALSRSRRRGDCSCQDQDSMSFVWDAGRGVRAELNKEFPIRVLLKCRCGRSLGFLFGTAERPCRHYVNGSVPGPILSNAPTRLVHYSPSPGPGRPVYRKCKADWQVSVDTLRAAYRRAAAKPLPERILVLPYDLQPVAGR